MRSIGVVRGTFTSLLLSLFLAGWCAAQQVGDCVRLAATNPEGVPIHREARNSFGGRRFADGTIARVTARNDAGSWLFVAAADGEGWISSKYVGGVVPCTGDVPAAPLAPTATTPHSITIGCWNLEWLKDGMKRGFPEFDGGEKFPPRTLEDYQSIARIIRDLRVRILVLEEINGKSAGGEEEDDAATSVELDRLVAALAPAHYAYRIESSGSAQRVALLFDTDVVHLEWAHEADLDNPVVDGSSLFAREPFLGYFKIFVDGQEMNDLVVVGVHLASKQSLVKNHDQAMHALTAWLRATQSASGFVPSHENDIVIAGDFNASRFDGAKEAFWDEMEADGWDVLADSVAYPATRLSGKPPAQRDSRIDYVIVSRGNGGLGGDEVTATEATVHGELVDAFGGGLEFRRHVSDHLPVLIDVAIRADDD